MEQKLIKEINAAEGMKVVDSMVRLKYIASAMTSLCGGTDASNQYIITSGMNHTMLHGANYYYPDAYVDKLQKVIHEIGKQLLDVEILPIPQNSDDYPMCYGDTYQEKFKQLGKYISIPYLFVNVMGRTLRWQKMHLCDKREKYYNNFTEAELAEINNAIRSIALTICSIKLLYEKFM